MGTAGNRPIRRQRARRHVLCRMLREVVVSSGEESELM